jgi:uncharacterized protein YecT (DUF1311 family)
MRSFIFSVCVGLAAVAPAAAQRIPNPADSFAGQEWGGRICDPGGNMPEMTACLALWNEREDAALQESVERLLAYAREQEARSPIFRGEYGYVGVIQSAQSDWAAHRDHECYLMTLGETAGSMRRLTLPRCAAQMTALRRERLDQLLALWQAEFRNSDGELHSADCIIEPALDRCRYSSP